MQDYILAVDDEPNIVRLIQVKLERLGYKVETANNGAEAIDKIKENRPSLLITDVMMPVMGGFELLAYVRDDPALADLPVILLTARPNHIDYMHPDDPDHSLFDIPGGADCYLIKPFHLDTLICDVERFVGSPTSNSRTTQ